MSGPFRISCPEKVAVPSVSLVCSFVVQNVQGERKSQSVKQEFRGGLCYSSIHVQFIFCLLEQLKTKVLFHSSAQNSCWARYIHAGQSICNCITKGLQEQLSRLLLVFTVYVWKYHYISSSCEFKLKWSIIYVMPK